MICFQTKAIWGIRPSLQQLVRVGIERFSKMSFYAVARGRQVGIFDSWSRCETEVKNFKGAKFKKFKTREEAENFIKTENGSSCVDVKQFKPEDVAIALGRKKAPLDTNESASKSPDGDFWPESDGDACEGNNDITDDELLSALAEVEGFPETSSVVTGEKRKIANLNTSAKYKIPKYDSKVWEPCGLKNVGSYEFQIDSEGFVIVYTDGSCLNNGRQDAVAGFGVFFGDNHPLNAAMPVCGRVTNNAGEIQASIHAIKVAKDLGITKLCISTDSQFLINAVTSWISAWKRKNWHLKNGDPVKNVDDFKVLDDLLMDDSISVKWNYVKAHKGIEGNEMADRLAREGSEIYRQRFLK